MPFLKDNERSTVVTAAEKVQILKEEGNFLFPVRSEIRKLQTLTGYSSTRKSN